MSWENNHPTLLLVVTRVDFVGGNEGVRMRINRTFAGANAILVEYAGFTPEFPSQSYVHDIPVPPGDALVLHCVGSWAVNFGMTGYYLPLHYLQPGTLEVQLGR